jgi:hypothetical protein
MEQNTPAVETKIVIKQKVLTRSIFTIDEEEENQTVLSSRTGGWQNGPIQEIGQSEYFENISELELNESLNYNYK